MNRQTVYAIALGAGIAAGLVAVAAGMRGSTLFLLLAAPLPVYLAALGWGTAAGTIAAVAGAGVTLFLNGPVSAAITAMLLFAPAALAGHLANLARPDSQGQGLVWYPLSSILLRLAGAVGAGCVITGIVTGYRVNALVDPLMEAMRQVFASDPSAVAPPEDMLEQSVRFYAAIFPAVVPAIWLAIHVLVMHIAAVITARSGLLARPAEDIAANLRLPVSALAIPVLGIAGMALLPSPAYEISAVAAGLGITVFALSGIAELHVVTRGRPARTIVLFFAWLAFVVLGFPAFVFAAIGMARSLRPASPNPPPPGIPPGPGNLITKR